MLEPNYSQRDQWQLAHDSTALLLVDVQRSIVSPETRETRPRFHQQVVGRVLPNQKRLVAAARQSNIEVVYSVIEALTADGRDRSLDHKLSGILVPKGSPLGQVIPDVAPQGDEIVLRKTSSGVFNSTNIDYVLRNLAIKSLIVCGFLTDQCVDLAIRDAADRGYFVVCAEDACAAHSERRHSNALAAFGGYCRIATTAALLAELEPRGRKTPA